MVKNYLDFKRFFLHLAKMEHQQISWIESQAYSLEHFKNPPILFSRFKDQGKTYNSRRKKFIHRGH